MCTLCTYFFDVYLFHVPSILQLRRYAMIKTIHFILRYVCDVWLCLGMSFFISNRLGFADVKYVAAFKEHELELMVDDSAALVASIESRLSGAGAPTYSTYDNPAIKAMQAANTQVE